MSNLIKYFILPLILIIVALGSIYWVVLPIWSNVGVATELRKASEDNLAERKKLTANLEGLIGQYTSRANDFSSFSRAVPVGKNVPDLLVNFEALASENGMIFSNINFQNKEATALSAKILTIDIQVKGSYQAFQNYLKAIEKSLRLFDVVSVSFSGIAPGAAQVNTNALEFNLSIDTYYQ